MIRFPLSVRGLGGFLVFAGLVSCVLRLIGLNLRILLWVDLWGAAMGWLIRLGVIAIGAAMLVVPMLLARKSQPAAQPRRAGGHPQPPAFAPPAAYPPGAPGFAGQPGYPPPPAYPPSGPPSGPPPGVAYQPAYAPPPAPAYAPPPAPAAPAAPAAPRPAPAAPAAPAARPPAPAARPAAPAAQRPAPAAPRPAPAPPPARSAQPQVPKTPLGGAKRTVFGHAGMAPGAAPRTPLTTVEDDDPFAGGDGGATEISAPPDSMK